MTTTTQTTSTSVTGLYLFMARVYAWMTAGLMLTAIVAVLVYSVPSLSGLITGNEMIFYALSGGEILFVLLLTSQAKKIPGWLAGIILVAYSVLNGICFASIFLIFTGASIATTFFTTAGTFLIMSLYGFFTKRDLGSVTHILMMLVIGAVMATLANLILQNEMLDWIISYAGVAVFIGLTAYNTKEIKDMYSSDKDENKKESIVGALVLYLDFINIFMMLLRILGIKKENALSSFE